MPDDIALRLLSFLGLFVMIALAWACSENRRSVPWRLVFWAMVLQFALGLVVLRTPFGVPFFGAVRSAFDVLTQASEAGASFVFGNLTKVIILNQGTTIGADATPAVQEPMVISAVLAFRVLPVIIFVSALSAILQHLGVIQAVVRGLAWLMRRTLKTSGAETFGAALLVFLGIESVSALGAYLKSMTRSEIFTLMCAFLATIAASVMVTYASFGADPGHLLAASLMSAPAAIAMAKIMVPELGNPPTSGTVRIALEVESHSVFDAASRGASLGLSMALNVAAMLIVFVGLIHVVDLLVSTFSGSSTTQLVGWFFRPLAFAMGVPAADLAPVSELLATKSVFNEFLAYSNMQPLIESGGLSQRSIVIATYALCGFANPGSLGIMIGALASMVPERRAEVAQLSLRAYVAGSLACFCTACVAGVLL